MSAPNPKHPAKFSPAILDAARVMLEQEAKRLGRPVSVLDPFAGVGRVHELAKFACVERTVGIEIEEPWAACHQDTIWANSIVEMGRMAREGIHFDVVFTSPTYGNRFADSHEAKDGSRRRSYTHDLGRKVTPGSSAAMHWGPKYWRFHAAAYRIIHGLEPDLFILNVSDFVKAKTIVPATMWHRGACHGAGWYDHERRPVRLVDTPRMRDGANPQRADNEAIFQFRPYPLIPKEQP